MSAPELDVGQTMGGRSARDPLVALFLLALAPIALAQHVELASVAARPVDRSVPLPGEFRPYQEVAIHAKVTGFIDRVLVDRGSVVKKDQLLATLEAPELKAQRAEAEAKVQSLEAQRAEAEARLVSEQTTYERMKTASATPGAIAANELSIAEKGVDAARAQVNAVGSSIRAAQSAVKAIEDMEQYLKVTAPFDGVITERNVHPGALVGRGGEKPMFDLEQISRLRLVVAVPELDVAGIPMNARATFTVPAYPGQTFHAVIARVSRSMDPKTRSMAVELDVANPRGELAPGMYPTVNWPVRNPKPALLVPATSVVTTTERTFVIRAHNGVAEWVNVRKGPAVSQDTVEVVGPLSAGDQIVKRASDEIREGAKLQ